MCIRDSVCCVRDAFPRHESRDSSERPRPYIHTHNLYSGLGPRPCDPSPPSIVVARCVGGGGMIVLRGRFGDCRVPVVGLLWVSQHTRYTATKNRTWLVGECRIAKWQRGASRRQPPAATLSLSQTDPSHGHAHTHWSRV
eukprot:6359245-Prymnesium_polylepis.1